ncbi:MAG: DUF4124 domain-containing protein, partial [Proteobacteria bacterium]|nr:DUF4124 domain-containing protein [Pseudomonadota bacterium]
YLEILFYLFFMMLMTTSASANIFKCVSEDGVITFSDIPCNKDAQLFIHDTKLSVDEAIGNASPYKHPVIYSGYIDQDLILHARKIGNSIFPDKRLEDKAISAERIANKQTWRVCLSYGSIENKFDYARIQLNYVGESEGDGEKVFVRLKYIAIKRFDWMTPLPTLKNVKKLKADAHYGWHVIP